MSISQPEVGPFENPRAPGRPRHRGHSKACLFGGLLCSADFQSAARAQFQRAQADWSPAECNWATSPESCRGSQIENLRYAKHVQSMVTVQPPQAMKLQELKTRIAAKAIDTIVVAFPDVFGR